MTNKQTSKKSQLFKLLLSLFLLLAAVWIFFNRNYVIDEIALRQYTPTAEITSIAERTQMTDHSKRFFYVSHPEINNAEQFNKNCQSKDEQSIVLGCYTMRKIYIFNVTDERLNGVKEVTAAHEMLHAAYDRLSNTEKKRVNALLEEESTKVQNPRLINLIALYKKTDPDQIQNELHSILPTEVPELSPELEEYYARYFEDRQLVVGLSQQYEAVFAENETRRTQLQTELELLRSEIESRTVSFNGGITQLNTDIEAFNQKAQNGSFASQSQFNNERQRLINRQQALQQERAIIDSRIDLFNQKRQELIALNGEAQSLNQSLDSTPEDVPNF